MCRTCAAAFPPQLSLPENPAPPHPGTARPGLIPQCSALATVSAPRHSLRQLHPPGQGPGSPSSEGTSPRGGGEGFWRHGPGLDMGREGIGLTATGKRCHLVVTAGLLRLPLTSGQASRPLQAPTLNGHPDSSGPCLPLVGSLSFGVVLGIEPKASRVPSTHTLSLSPWPCGDPQISPGCATGQPA